MAALKREKDVSEGAAKYNNYGITTVALSNVVDSLFNIKKLVFKDKKYSLAEMNKARVENFDSAPEMFIEVTSLKSPTGMILLKWKRWSTVSHPLLLL